MFRDCRSKYAYFISYIFVKTLQDWRKRDTFRNLDVENEKNQDA